MQERENYSPLFGPKSVCNYMASDNRFIIENLVFLVLPMRYFMEDF